MEKKYPFIELPRILKKDLIDTATPNRIARPIPPKKHHLKKPTPKNEKPWYKRVFLLFFIMLIVPYTIFTIWATPSYPTIERETFWLLVFVLISAIVWAFYDLFITERRNTKRKIYDKTEKKYQIDAEKYSQDIENFEYNEKLWRMKENPQGKEALEEKHKFIVHQLMNSPAIKNVNYAQPKLAVQYLSKKITEYKEESDKGFKGNTFQYEDGYQFFKNEEGTFYFNRTYVDINTDETYSTDLIYWLPEMNLHINIEIDEPYDLKTKYPKHSIVNESVYDTGKKILKSVDETRDKFFKEKNWIVIRFAEEQIIKEPKKCYEAIIWVASFFSSPLFNFKDFEYYLNWDIKAVNRWMKEEAIDLAAGDFRLSYLKDHFILN